MIEIFSSQMGVTRGGHDFKDTVINGQNTDIEGSSSQVKYQDVFLSLFLIQTVGNGGGSGFIQDSDNVQTSNKTGIFSSLSLSIVEISRDSDNSVDHLVTNKGLGDFFHFG